MYLEHNRSIQEELYKYLWNEIIWLEWISAFYHSNGSQLDGFLADSSSMASVDHIRHILVGLWGLLHHQLGGSHPHTDALICQLVENLPEVQVPPGLGPAQRAACPMAGGAKGLLHALLGASKDIAAGAHRAPDQHRLPSELVVNRDEWVVGRESSSASLPVNQQPLSLPLN